MCGIIAYRGKRSAGEVLLHGLRQLEYRGYDSWGIALKNGHELEVVRRTGKISASAPKLARHKGLQLGLGHTRWATHGGVTESNSHPHRDCSGSVVLAHNGIVENYQELKRGLQGHRFSSETDTEVIAHLVEKELAGGAPLREAFRSAFLKLEGRNAVVLLSGEELLVAKSGSPMVLGLGDGESFVASDVPAFLRYTDRAVFLADGEMAVIGDDVRLYDLQGTPKPLKEETIEWSPEQAEKGEYPHFMLKEMMEQPEALLRAGNLPKEDLAAAVAMVRKAKRVFAIGCGTAAQVANLSTYLFSCIAEMPSQFAIGSEFSHLKPAINQDTLVIAVSQSGETADLLEAVATAKERGAKVLAVLNVKGSSLMREAHHTLLVNAGPEKAVASTKATTAQMAVLLLLAHAVAGRADEGKRLIESASRAVREMLSRSEEMRALAQRLRDRQNIYIIGRGMNYPVAREGAIKIQEVSTLHAEGIAGGELKHYALALVEKGTPCIVLGSGKDILGNAMEIKSRGGDIIGLSPERSEVFDTWIQVPDLGPASAIVQLVPLQLLAYHLGIARGMDPDYCRNLAKSVTVK
ncbi:glutamine--fructose-6-phosphate transaminase (isomerizing) [Candidatus Woesearchaeota archaeon]|nr:glutamine--fructose-6-phosphate transaminase (isomerizing) [Candidatus Woesearchaeota archaeon]